MKLTARNRLTNRVIQSFTNIDRLMAYLDKATNPENIEIVIVFDPVEAEWLDELTNGGARVLLTGADILNSNPPQRE